MGRERRVVWIQGEKMTESRVLIEKERRPSKQHQTHNLSQTIRVVAKAFDVCLRDKQEVTAWHHGELPECKK